MGCPEKRVDAAIAALLAKGYKVGRIDQLETAAQAKERAGPGANKRESIIRRDLTEVLNPVTMVEGRFEEGMEVVRSDPVRADWGVPGLRVGRCRLRPQTDLVSSHFPLHLSFSPPPPFPDPHSQAYLMALVEGAEDSSAYYGDGPGAAAPPPKARFGFAYLEAAAGRVFVGEAGDLELCTLLVQVAPKELLCCRGGLGPDARNAVAAAPSRPRVVRLTQGEDFPLPTRAAHALVGSFGALSLSAGASWLVSGNWEDSVEGLHLGCRTFGRRSHLTLMRWRFRLFPFSALFQKASTTPMTARRGPRRCNAPPRRPYRPSQPSAATCAGSSRTASLRKVRRCSLTPCSTDGTCAWTDPQ